MPKKADLIAPKALRLLTGYLVLGLACHVSECLGQTKAGAKAEAAPAAAQTVDPKTDPNNFANYADILAKWPPEIAAAALTLSERPQEKWSWIYVNVNEDETEEIRWDPSLPPAERSVLLNKNGAPATAKEKAAHAEKMEKSLNRRSTTPAASRLARTRAWLETLEFHLVEDNALSSTWRVVSRDEDFDDLPVRDRIRNRVLAELKSRIVVSKSPPGFLEISMKNDGDIRAYFSVHLREVDILLRNARVPGTHHFFPIELRGKVRGRYLLLGNIDTAWSTTFRDYELAKPDASNSAKPDAEDVNTTTTPSKIPGQTTDKREPGK